MTLCLSQDGAVWAGTSGKGLWRIRGEERRRFTDGRRAFERCGALDLPGPEGTLWIGTFGGGLSAFRDGRFLRYTEKDGLLSDNVAKIIDDGAALWLATTRGICRVWRASCGILGRPA